MKRYAMAIGLAALAFLGGPAAAGAPEVVDDWRKVGPPDAGDKPRAKATLSPAAAERLVAAIDRAWRGGQPLRARGDKLEWIVENLRYVFLRADGRPVPPRMGPASSQEESRDVIRRIDVLGSRCAGGHCLVLSVVNVSYYVPSDTYAPATLGIVLGADGTVADLAILGRIEGDVCYWDERAARVDGDALHVADSLAVTGALCADEFSPDDDCCMVAEGEKFDLEVGRDGRFQEKDRSRFNLSGQFADRKTGEELRIEDAWRRQEVRVGYRGKARTPWKGLKVISFDRTRGVVIAQFPKSPVAYTLTIAPDGKSLVSTGSDGSKPQRFGWLSPAERAPPP